jgi:4-hydroxybenzoate polyprenyltransferase
VDTRAHPPVPWLPMSVRPMQTQQAQAAGPVALLVRAVDLVRTDLLLEAALAQVRRSPASAPALLGWRLGGRAKAEARLTASGALDPAALPLRAEILEQIRGAQAAGRPVFLTAARSSPLLAQVASHLGITLHDVGAELPLHETAACAPERARHRARAALRALRPHQWVKNALVLLPPLLAHAQVQDVWSRAAVAFVAFCLCASSVYLLNDLLDLHADRAHDRKRLRPFASGELPLGFGLVAAPALLAGAFGLALWLSPAFAGVLGAYYLVTLAYSLWLKRVALLDVLVLAGLYTVRIVGGGVAAGVIVSQWLLGFSLFLFTSLAFVKRYSEVHGLRRSGRDEAHGRGYRAGDLELLQTLGTAAGYLAVLVLALYVSSQDVTRLYAHPERLWALVPLILFWVSRVWLLAHRGQMHDDPIVFAIRDRVSYGVALLAGACVVWAA